MHPSSPSIARVIGIAAVLGWACSAKLFTITVEDSSAVIVERGTLLEQLIGDLGFDDFVAMNIVDSEELENQGVAPGDIRETFLVQFELEALEPAGSDLAFLDELVVYVEAPGLPRVQVARGAEFPDGQGRVDLDLEPVDLTDYVVSESMTLSTDVTARRPEQDTLVEARFALDVGVTGQGACNQARGGQSDEEAP